MSHLQRHLNNLKSLQNSPIVLLSACFDLFQNLDHELTQNFTLDKSAIKKYYQFLVECYKLIEKNILNPQHLRHFNQPNQMDTLILIIKQFIIYWMNVTSELQDIVTLKMWINFLQKINLLKAEKEALWLSKIYLEVFYPQMLSISEKMSFNTKNLNYLLKFRPQESDLQLSETFVNSLRQALISVCSNIDSLNIDTLRILINCVLLRTANLTSSENSFLLANKSDWGLLLSCYETLWQLHETNSTGCAELYTIYFKDYFKMMYKFSGLGLDRNIVDPQTLWKIRIQSFMHVIQGKAIDANDLGCYLIDTLSKMNKDENTKNNVRLIAFLYQTVTRAIFETEKRLLQNRNVLSFYYKILTSFEETSQDTYFCSALSLLIMQNQTDMSFQNFCDIEFWNHNLNKAHYLPSVISFVLTKLTKIDDSQNQFLNILFTNEFAFCIKGLRLLLSLKLLNKEQRGTENLETQIEYMMSKLTKVYNSLEKIKMSVLNTFLNRRTIISTLESQTDLSQHSNGPVSTLILQIQNKETQMVIPEFMDIQAKLFKILVTKDNNISVRVSAVNINNKFYQILYVVALWTYNPQQFSLVNLQKATHDFVEVLTSNKEILDDASYRKELQSSFNYLSKIFEVINDNKKKRQQIKDLSLVVETLAETIGGLQLLKKFELRTVLSTCTSVYKILRDSIATSKSSFICCSNFRQTLVSTLEYHTESYKTYSLEERDSLHKLFEVLVRIEAIILKVDLNDYKENNSKVINPELENSEFIHSLEVVPGNLQNMTAYSKDSYGKFLLKARIKTLAALLSEENIQLREAAGILEAIGKDMESIITHLKQELNQFRSLKYKVLWTEVIYTSIAARQNLLLCKETELESFDDIILKQLKSLKTSQIDRFAKYEEILLKLLKEDIIKELNDMLAIVSLDKMLQYYLLLSDVHRKIVYLCIYVELQSSIDVPQLEKTSQTTSVILTEFRNSIKAFQSALKIAINPEKGFDNYMSNCLDKKSKFRTAFTQLLQNMKISEILRVQKLLSSHMEIAEYLSVSNEAESSIKIMLIYWVSLGNQLSGAFDKKTRNLFNTRIQLVLGITQLKLAMLYHNKGNVQDSEKCYKNFEGNFQKENVKKTIALLQEDQQYQPFILEIKGLLVHLESLMNEYKISINHSDAIEEFKTFILELENDSSLEKLKNSYAFMFLKVKLLLYSGRILYSCGYPAYSIQETRKCLDYLINYGFNYTRSQAIDQILTKEMDCKADRSSRVCLMDLKSLNEASQYMRELCKPSGADTATNLGTIANIVNMLFPKSLALNYSKLNMLCLVAKTVGKLTKISYNIGLLYYSEYYLNIFKEFTLKSTQVLRYLKFFSRENIRKQDNDILLAIQKEDRLHELNGIVDCLNILACPSDSQQKTLTTFKKTYACTEKLLDKIHSSISQNVWLDAAWKSVLADTLCSLLKLYSAGNEGKESEGFMTSETIGLTDKSEFQQCSCDVLKEFLESNGKFQYNRVLNKDWHKQEHVIYETKSIKIWQKALQIINMRTTEVSHKDEFDLESLIWLRNCVEILNHIVSCVSLLHTPLAKQALLIRNILLNVTRKAIIWIISTESYKLIEDLEKCTKLNCGCGEYLWTQQIGTKTHRANLVWKGSFSREIDFWLTYSDTVFMYKHQIKNIRKVMKNKGGKDDRKDELKYLRKSIKTLKLHDENGNTPDLSLILNLKVNVKRRFEEFSVKSPYFIQNVQKLLGNNPITVIKFLKKKSHKTLFIGKIFADPQKNVCFVIEDRAKTNFLSDLLLDFSKIISNIEKDLNETSKEQKDDKEKANINASQWWKERFALDKRLESLLKSLEGILDVHKGFLMNDFTDENLNLYTDNEFKQLEELLISDIRSNFTPKVFESLEKELRKEIYGYIQLLKGLVLFSITEKHSEASFTQSFEELNGQNLGFKMMTQAQREAYSTRVLELRRDVFAAIEGKNARRKPGDETFPIPFECMPAFLSQGQNFLRIPSLEYIKSIYHEENHVNLQNTFYVLNPSKDLKRTQQKFQTFLQKKETWQGIIGCEPTKPQLKQALTENDCYLYIGHGAGEKYFNEGELKEIMKIRSAVFLIGCSSAKQVKAQNYINKGEAELAGISIEYLLCNCPFLIGNLWDVTDKDMDAMTEHMLESTTAPNSVTDLLEIIQQSRNRCKMKYLNGAALVCYGIPMSFIY